MIYLVNILKIFHAWPCDHMQVHNSLDNDKK